MLLQQGCSCLLPVQGEAQRPAQQAVTPGPVGARVQALRQGLLTLHLTVNPSKAKEKGGSSGGRGSLPFPALLPILIHPSSFPSHCRGREMQVRLEFPSKLWVLLWDSPLTLSVSLVRAWGKPNQQR